MDQLVDHEIAWLPKRRSDIDAVAQGQADGIRFKEPGFSGGLAQVGVRGEGDLINWHEADALRISDPHASGVGHLGLGQPDAVFKDQLLLLFGPGTGQGQEDLEFLG